MVAVVHGSRMSPLRTGWQRARDRPLAVGLGLASAVVLIAAAPAVVASCRADDHESNQPAPRCAGVPMKAGQRDIDAAPSGTTFCLSGTHNWTLTPKSGDRFIGPAVLDGGNTTTSAFLGGGTASVTLANLEVRNYRA